MHSYRKTSTDFRWFSASIWVFNTLSAWCEDSSCAYLRLFEKRLHEVGTAARWRSGRPASARTRLQLQAHGRLLRDRSVISGVMLWRARPQYSDQTVDASPMTKAATLVATKACHVFSPRLDVQSSAVCEGVCSSCCEWSSMRWLSGHPIDPVKFREYCDRTADFYVAEYPWY